MTFGSEPQGHMETGICLDKIIYLKLVNYTIDTHVSPNTLRRMEDITSILSKVRSTKTLTHVLSSVTVFPSVPQAIYCET